MRGRGGDEGREANERERGRRRVMRGSGEDEAEVKRHKK